MGLTISISSLRMPSKINILILFTSISIFFMASCFGKPSPPIADKAALEIGLFSKGQVGNSLPNGWDELNFKKIPQHTRYQLIKHDDSVVIKANSNASASGLVKKVKINLKETPIIQWRWKIANTLQNSDVYKKSGDDYPARIYIMFEYDPDKVGFFKKAKYKAGRLIFGDIPIAAINYIWANKAAKNTIVENAYTDFTMMVVAESGDEKIGQWINEERNVYDDYVTAFGEEPPLINAIAIMSDTDNTGESATAYYGDILFKRSTDP